MICSIFSDTSALYSNSNKHPRVLLGKTKLYGGYSEGQAETASDTEAAPNSQNPSNASEDTSSDSDASSSSASASASTITPAGTGTELETGTTETEIERIVEENVVDNNNAMGLPQFMTTLVAPSNRDIAFELQDTDSYDEILSICEKIPAISTSVDKAMRITFADRDDALLCALAVQRLSYVSLKYAMASTHETETHTWAGLDSDRRFQQLTECVELNMKDLSIRDLSRYLRGLMALPFQQEELVRSSMDEFSER